MDAIFWAGLILGFLLSIVAGLVANLYSESLIKKFQGRRAVLEEKNREREIGEYGLLRRVHIGKKNAFVFFIRRVVFINLFYMTGTSVFIISALGTVSDIEEYGVHRALAGDPAAIMRQLLSLGFLAIGAFAIAIAAKELFRLLSELHRLDDFEAYEEEVLSKYGLKRPNEPEA